jgi:hypothetical protein
LQINDGPKNWTPQAIDGYVHSHRGCFFNGRVSLQSWATAAQIIFKAPRSSFIVTTAAKVQDLSIVNCPVNDMQPP